MNTRHDVNMQKDYYISIFNVTKAQYERIANNNKKESSSVPKGDISWNTIRGSAGVLATPTTGVMANLNAKTELSGWDLPTESMYEVAARAGCNTANLCGDTLTGISDYAWGSDTSRNVFQPVGLKKPNNWGLYDVQGNVWEICRDNGNDGDLATLQPNGLVPISTGDSTRMPLRTQGNNVVYSWGNIGLSDR